MFLNRRSSKIGKISQLGFVMAIAGTIVVIVSYRSSASADLKQRTFKSPDEAVKALIDSVRGKDTKELPAHLRSIRQRDYFFRRRGG